MSSGRKSRITVFSGETFETPVFRTLATPQLYLFQYGKSHCPPDADKIDSRLGMTAKQKAQAIAWAFVDKLLLSPN
jgi:hypothetical protein